MKSFSRSCCRIFLEVTAILTLASCGTDDSKNETGGSTAAECANCVEMPLFSKKLKIQNDFVSAGCNKGLFTYLMMSGKCQAATITTSYAGTIESWTAKFTDGSTAFNGTLSSDFSKITISGIQYFCFQGAASSYAYKGSEKIYSHNALLVKTSITKPGDVKEGDIFAFGSISSGDMCAAVH